MWCVEKLVYVNISNSVFNEHDIDLNDENILVTEKSSIKAEGLQ